MKEVILHCIFVATIWVVIVGIGWYFGDILGGVIGLFVARIVATHYGNKAAFNLNQK